MKKMKRLQSRKSHSWWWDSHVSPKNSKWLADNLEEMDQSVRRMLKLIEEDADSFAKKAEMYYQKRPELITLVEDFYRMYRSLAERYDHVTGELRKNISDLQSQGSGISDILSELTPKSQSSALGQRKSGPRAPGFDFFLGSGGSSSDLRQKEGDESSTLTDSEPESDDSSVNNYAGLMGNIDQGLSKKVIELEIELRATKEKLQMQNDENGDGSFDLFTRIAQHEQELAVANERIPLLEEEVDRLNTELQKYKSMDPPERNFQTREVEAESNMEQASQPQESLSRHQDETLGSNNNLQALVEELRIARDNIQDSEKEIARLKHQLDSEEGATEKVRNLQQELSVAHKETNTWKAKFNAEKREVLKLQERIARMKASLSDRDHEVRELKIAVSDAEQKIFPEKAQIKAEISRLLEEQTWLKEQLREWESRGRSLEDEIRMFQTERTEVERRLNNEIEQLKADISERDDVLKNLEKSIEELNSEREQLRERVAALKEDVGSRDNQIDEMNKQLHQLHLEQVKLISGAEEASKVMDELRSKAKDLEDEVEKQRTSILEGEEGKREAIRQLCFSLEHYRNRYHRLRQAFAGHRRRLPVLAN